MATRRISRGGLSTRGRSAADSPHVGPGARGVVVLIPALCASLVGAPTTGGLLTLQEAEHQAATTGFEMRVKYFEERAREWERRNAVARYLPSLSYSLGYTATDPEMVDEANAAFEGFGDMAAAFPGAEIDPDDFAQSHDHSISHEFSVSQPISNGGVEIVAMGIAGNTKKAIELQQEAARQEVVYTTRKAYFDALAAAERTAVAREDLAWTKQNLSKSRIRRRAGAVPATDVLQWEAETAQKESDLLQAQAAQRFTVLTLFQTMGIPAAKVDTGVRLQPLEVFEGWSRGDSVLAEGSVVDNPQLEAVAYLTKAARGSWMISVTQMLPKANAWGSYSVPYYWSDHKDELRLDDRRRGWRAGVNLTVPLFSGLKNATNYRKSKYEYHKAQVERRRMESRFRVNLKRIELFHQAAYKGVSAARKKQKLMEKNLEIMQMRYDGGLVNQSQLLEVSLGARMARIGYIQKLFECLLLEAEYLKSIGKLEVTR